jgi:hypothetical protein
MRHKLGAWLMRYHYEIALGIVCAVVLAAVFVPLLGR